MTYWDKKLVREQLDKKLSQYKGLASYSPEIGWIKLIREALGLSTKQLGKRVGIDQSRISRLENAETENDLKLSSLKKIAKGLNMQFVYAFIPNESLESMVYQQAKKIAVKRMKKVNHSMQLESQEITENDKNETLQDLIQKILLEEPKDFWDQ